MKVSTIIIIVFFLVALLGSIAGTSYYYFQSVEVMEEQVFQHLESVAQSRAAHIETFLMGQKNKILIAATHKELSNDELKEIVNLNEDYTEMIILDSNGIIVSSSEESIIGIDKSNDFYFIEGQKGLNFKEMYVSDSLNELAFAIFTPQGEDNVLVVRIDTSVLNELLLDKTGIGETGETYLINEESYAITPLLFVEDAPLKLKVDSINSRECFEHKGNLEGRHDIKLFLDYVGKQVIGTHVYIPEMKWCLLAEINEEEMLGKQRALFRGVGLTIIIFTVIIITLIGFFVGKFIDKRVVLKKGKKKL